MALFDGIFGGTGSVAPQDSIGRAGFAGSAGNISGFGNASSVLDGAERTAENAIVNEQLKTIGTKIRAKKNEGAYARAGTFLSQNVG